MMHYDVPMNKNQAQSSGYRGVIQLSREDPHWLPIVAAALEETARVDAFAGAWVLKRAKKRGVRWIPNLRKLVSYGILRKDGESSRGGRRAYYSMPDVDGVKRALEKIGKFGDSDIYPAIDISGTGVSRRQTVPVPFYLNLASCGSPNMVDEAHVDDYIEVDTRLARPGHKYYLVRADGDSMNAAGINSGDLVLVREQNHADIGQKVVACLDDGVTIKELQRRGNFIVLVPRSTNLEHKQTILADNFQVQGVVVATIPNPE